jgi:hypothetical protein
LKQAEPGHRFRDLFEYRAAQRESAWSPGRIAWVGAGVLLLVGGLAIGWLPGPGGFVAVFGAAMLATEWRPLAKALDESERVLRVGLRWCRDLWRDSSTVMRLTFALGVAASGVVLAWMAVAIITG